MWQYKFSNTVIRDNFSITEQLDVLKYIHNVTVSYCANLVVIKLIPHGSLHNFQSNWSLDGQIMCRYISDILLLIFEGKNVNKFLFISLNIFYGCSKELSQ